jgi:hypothetical protein
VAIMSGPRRNGTLARDGHASVIDDPHNRFKRR